MFRKAVVALTTLGLGLGVAAASISGASAAPLSASHVSVANPEAPTTPSITRYAGEMLNYTLNGKPAQDWMGSYVVDGKIRDCLTPGKVLALPTHYSNGVYGTARQSAEISYIDNHWGVSSSSSVAAGARLAMLDVLGRTGEYKDLKVPANLAAYAKADLANAAKFAGPYKAAVTFASKPTTPGQHGVAVFGLKSAKNDALIGTAVKFSAVSATIAATGSSGHAQAFVRTEPDPVKVSGVATGLSSPDVSIGTAGPSDQTLVVGLPESASASAVYQAGVASPKVTAKCNCNGTGTVTGVISQAAGAAEGRYTLKVNGNPVKSLTLAAGQHTGDIVVVAADKSVVTFTRQYLVNGSWTAPVAFGSAFTVHCPVLPEVSFSVNCNCTSVTGDGYTTSIKLGLVNPSTDYTDELVYTVNGVQHTVVVPAGTSTAPISFTVGETASVSYYGVVEGAGVSTPVGTWGSQS